MIEQFLYEDVDGETVARLNPEYEKATRQQKYEIYLKKSYIPKEYQKYNFDSVKGIPEKTIEKCRLYAENFDSATEMSLYLWGERTIGKTTLACVTGMQILKKGFDVKFSKASDMQDMMLKLQGYSFDEVIKDRYLKLMNCDLLIIDDAFDRGKSVYWRNSPELIITEWNSLIRDRVYSERPMLITSNVSVQSLRGNWGDDIHEMLSDNRGKFIPINYDNPDLKMVRAELLENSK